MGRVHEPLWKGTAVALQVGEDRSQCGLSFSSVFPNKLRHAPRLELP